MKNWRYRYAIAELICYLVYSLVSLYLFYRNPGWFGLAAIAVGMAGMTRYSSKILQVLSSL